jgi:hypothetical protein
MVVINAVNFVDGLDGLATGIVAICAMAFFGFSYLLAVVNGLNRAGAPSLFTAVIIGICVGFLPHNYHPARIFMGDSGAMFLGLILSAAAITLTGQIDVNAITSQRSNSALLPLLLPFTILAIPLIDLGMAIVRRLRAGRSPFAADKEHLHHKLLSMGNSHRRTSAILYSWTAMFAFPTVAAAFAPLWLALLIGLAILLFSLVLLTKWPNRNKVLIKVGWTPAQSKIGKVNILNKDGKINTLIHMFGFLVAGVLIWGAIGWAVDKWIGHNNYFLIGGVVLGIGSSLYLAWLRFGRK